jgi:rare lipoprotein A
MESSMPRVVLPCLRWVRRLAPLLLALCSAAWAPGAPAAPKAAEADAPAPAASAPKARPLDHSGRKHRGIASFYHRKFNGRTMANGERMDPRDDNAASKTLPLGTRARVTNLENGRSTTVTIEDRGPYVKGRIIDVSPATAQQLGIDKEEGLAKVEVAPITVPQRDGSVKPGAAVTESSSP